jgi:ubiquinone biosynthesis monooxygenase Coq7
MKAMFSTRSVSTAITTSRKATRQVYSSVYGRSRNHSTSHSATPASYIYGVPTPAQGGPSKPPVIQQRPIEATTATPNNLAPEQRKLLEETIRVDHIGEAAANWIYQATKFVSEVKGDKKTAQQVEVSPCLGSGLTSEISDPPPSDRFQEMWATERHHLATLLRLQKQHRVRPTILYPIWKAMAMGLGAGTALMGKRAIMACTEAVETVIGEHYDE